MYKFYAPVMTKPEKDQLYHQNFQSKHLSELERVIKKLKSLCDCESSYNVRCAVIKLESTMRDNIEYLFSDTINQVKIDFFEAKSDLALREFDQSCEYRSDNSDETFYESIKLGLKPLKILIAIIVAALASPVLPFSASARNYVGSFFNTPGMNILTNEFAKLRGDIHQEATDFLYN